MNTAFVSSPDAVEYLIYTFDFPAEGNRTAARWHRYAALADEELALAQAQILSDTHKYRRIEVKKKYFDARKGRAMDTTLRVYENNGAKNLLKWLFFAGLAAGLGFAALLLLS